LIEEVERSEWEEDWHADTVHHCDESDIEEPRVFEMNDIVCTGVKGFVHRH